MFRIYADGGYRRAALLSLLITVPICAVGKQVPVLPPIDHKISAECPTLEAAVTSLDTLFQQPLSLASILKHFGLKSTEITKTKTTVFGQKLTALSSCARGYPSQDIDLILVEYKNEIVSFSVGGPPSGECLTETSLQAALPLATHRHMIEDQLVIFDKTTLYAEQRSALQHSELALRFDNKQCLVNFGMVAQHTISQNKSGKWGWVKY